MKITKWLIALFSLAAVSTLFAQTNGVPAADTVPASSGAGLLLIIIPLLVPIVVALAKTALPKIPTWVLPILAPALGALIDWISSLTTGHSINPVLAAALGSAGVGVREIVDQVKTRITDGAVPAKVALLFLIGALSFGTVATSMVVTGCTTSQQKTSYNTLYTLGSGVDSGLKAYLDLVATDKLATNSVPRVLKAYGDFQVTFNAAILIVAGNTNAAAPVDVITAAANFNNVVTAAKKGQ